MYGLQEFDKNNMSTKLVMNSSIYGLQEFEKNKGMEAQPQHNAME